MMKSREESDSVHGKTAIVIVAYNRPKCLNHLLRSLAKIRTEKNISLIISLEYQSDQKVKDLAKQFSWEFGEKILHEHKVSKGLVEHFIWVGQQTQRFNNVIFLEDDLLVSPVFLGFCEQLINFYRDDPKVAAASLYNPIINQLTGTRFYQIKDANDVYFLQQPYWGNIWFDRKWQLFSEYLTTYEEKKELLPENVANWTESFKKIYIQFLIEKGLFVVTPRNSLVTNQCATGLHSSGRGGYFHTPFETELFKYKLKKFDDSQIYYDAFLEINQSFLISANQKLSGYDFEVDLNGTKKIYRKSYVLTTKPVSVRILEFSDLMKPLESSVILDIRDQGGISLCQRDAVDEERIYYWRRRFKDISNNYYVGTFAAIFIVVDTLMACSQYLFRRFKKFFSR